jgi:hypothetical protein
MKHKIQIEVVTERSVSDLVAGYDLIADGAIQATISIDTVEEKKVAETKRGEGGRYHHANRPYAADPRIVWADPDKPYSKIDTEATLPKVGMSKEELVSRSWKTGTLEHALKRSIGAQEKQPNGHEGDVQ